MANSDDEDQILIDHALLKWAKQYPGKWSCMPFTEYMGLILTWLELAPTKDNNYGYKRI